MSDSKLATLKQLQELLSPIQKSLTSLDTRVTSLDEKVGSLNEKVTFLDERQGVLEIGIKSVSTEIKELRKEMINKNNTIINFLDQDNIHLKKRVERIEDHLQLST